MAVVEDDLDELRQSLDEIDAGLVRLLSERFQITERVGWYKRARGLPPIDPVRENFQFSRIEDLAQRTGLDQALVRGIFRLIIDEVVRSHRAIVEGGSRT